MFKKFQDNYCTVDTRTLGLFRIYFGLLLLTNLLDRAGGFDLISFYSNEGVLPNHFALFRPPANGFWSLLLGFSSPNEVRVALTVVGIVYALYTVGWQTKWMQVLALVFYASLNFRFLLIQHGGNVVMNIVLVWTLFLPVGARFSVDSVLKSLRGPPEKTPEVLNARPWVASVPAVHLGFAFFCICLNFAFIYLFNTVHKGGPAWMDGSAVHYVLWQNRMATTLDGWVRMHEPFWLSPLLTWGTLFAEGTMVLCILSPWKQRWLRTWAFVTCWGLHGGIATLSTLGPFSYSMMAFGVLMIQGADFDFLRKKLHRASLVRVVRADLKDPLQNFGMRVLARMDLLRHFTIEQGAKLEVIEKGGKPATGLAAWAQLVNGLPMGILAAWLFLVPLVADFLRGTAMAVGRWYLERGERAVVPAEGMLHRRVRVALQTAIPGVVLVAVLSQLSMENRAVPASLKLRTRPDFLTDIIEYLQIPQGWSMFAPDVPREDTLMVIDAVLADGTRIDLLTERPPDFEAPLHGPYFMNQHWCEMHARMRGWQMHWRNFRDYLVRIPKLKGWGPEKQVVSLEVWQVTATSPLPGSTEWTNLRKEKLFDLNI